MGVALGSRYTTIFERQKRDRQRAILDIDTVSYLRLTIVCLMENIVQIYKGQGVKCIFITLKQEKRIYIKLRQGQGETRFLI